MPLRQARSSRLPLILGATLALLTGIATTPSVDGLGSTRTAAGADRVVVSAVQDLAVHDLAAQDDRTVEAARPLGADMTQRWIAGSRTRFVVNPTGAPEGSVEAVRAAVATWTATGIGVWFDYGGTTGESGASADVDNVVSWLDLPEQPFVARTTTYWYADAPDELIGFDLVFNLAHDFAVGDAAFGRAAPGEPGDARWDVQTVALHEFGHVLGLGHAEPERILQVMRPRIAAGDVDHTLSLRDIEVLDGRYASTALSDTDGFFARGSTRRRTGFVPSEGSGHRPDDPGLFD